MYKVLCLVLVFASIGCGSKKVLVTEDFKIAMKKGGCFGSCPVYTISVDQNGLATFNGERFTEKFGVHTLQLDKREFDDLANAFASADLMQYDDFYESPIPDMPSITIDYVNNGTSKTIRGKGERPQPVIDLQRKLEDLANREDWISMEPAEEEVVEEEEEEEAVVENEFIIKFKNGTWLSKWVKSYNEFGLRVDKPLSDDKMTWLIRYDKSKMESDAFYEKLSADQYIESVEYNKVAGNR